MLIGAGGNIGSHLVPHLARMPEIRRLTLVDRDRYEERNRSNQELPSGAMGRPKALVQAGVARKLNPSLEVVAVTRDIETLPLGFFQADLLLTGLDSRRARQRVNYAARGLGVPWLDGGVLATGLLARMTRIDSEADTPCLECRWDDADYAALEQAYPCDPMSEPAPTGAPSSLGALAASMLALECGKILRGDPGVLAPGAELIVDSLHHRQYLTSARRFAGCRLSEHAPWTVKPLPIDRGLTLGRMLTDLGERLGANGDLSVAIEGSRIVRRMSCERCGRSRGILGVSGRLRPADSRCPACGGRTSPNGFGTHEYLAAASLTRQERTRTLATVGFRPGEVLRASGGGREHRFQLVSSAETPRRRDVKSTRRPT
jgi:molybdopterin/thiamine biosynthesis adenylyltransferase